MPENQPFPRDEHGRRFASGVGEDFTHWTNKDGSISRMLPNGMIWNEPPPPRPYWWEPADPALEKKHREQNAKYLEEARRWFLGQPGGDA